MGPRKLGVCVSSGEQSLHPESSERGKVCSAWLGRPLGRAFLSPPVLRVSGMWESLRHTQQAGVQATSMLLRLRSIQGPVGLAGQPALSSQEGGGALGVMAQRLKTRSRLSHPVLTAGEGGPGTDMQHCELGSPAPGGRCWQPHASGSVSEMQSLRPLAQAC